MPRAGMPHWRHEAWIYIYASTLPAFLTPHSHLPPRNPNRTSSQQIAIMPSTRTGRRYSAGPSMPSSSTLRQGLYVSSPSSTTSNSVLRSVSPYQQREQIPDITLQEYGRILDDDKEYVNLMAILYPQSDFYSRTVTMQQLLITAQKIRREADRLEEEGRRIFVKMEGLGLQQVLHPHRPSPSLEPYTRPPTPYYPAPDQEARSPTTPPMCYVRVQMGPNFRKWVRSEQGLGLSLCAVPPYFSCP